MSSDAERPVKRLRRMAGLSIPSREIQVDPENLRLPVHIDDGSLVPSPGIRPVFDTLADLDPEAIPNHRYNYTVMQEDRQRYQEFIDIMFGTSLERTEQQQQDIRARARRENTWIETWASTRPIFRDRVRLDRSVPERFLMTAERDREDWYVFVELQWAEETPENERRVLFRYNWMGENTACVTLHLRPGRYYTPRERHVAQSIAAVCEIRMNGYVGEDLLSIEHCYDYTWKEAVCDYFSNFDFLPREIDSPFQQQITILIDTRGNSELLYVNISATDLPSFAIGVYAHIENEVNNPPPGFESSPMYNFVMSEQASQYVENLRTAYVNEMTQRADNPRRTERQVRRGEDIVKKYLRAKKAIRWLQFAYEKLIWYRCDSVALQEAYVNLSSAYRPLGTTEMRRKSAEQISLVTFEVDEQPGQRGLRRQQQRRVLVFNENFRHPTDASEAPTRPTFKTRIRAPACLTTYGEQAISFVVTRYYLEFDNALQALEHAVDLLRWIEDGHDSGIPQDTLDILSRNAVRVDEMLCAHPRRDGMHQTSCCSFLKFCPELDATSDHCLVCQKIHEFTLRRPEYGQGLFAWDRARSAIQSDKICFSAKYECTLPTPLRLFQCLVADLRVVRDESGNPKEMYHCHTLNIDLDPEDTLEMWRPEFDAIDLVFSVISPDDQAWLARHYPGNGHWVPRCFNRMKGVLSLPTAIRLCQAMYAHHHHGKQIRFLRPLVESDPSPAAHRLSNWIEETMRLLERYRSLEIQIPYDVEDRASMSPDIVEFVFKALHATLPAFCTSEEIKSSRQRYQGDEALPMQDGGAPRATRPSIRRNDTVNPELDRVFIDYYQEKYGKTLPMSEGTRHVFTGDSPDILHSSTSEDLEYKKRNITLRMFCNRHHETNAFVSPRTLRLFAFSECLRLDGRDRDFGLPFTSGHRSATGISIGRLVPDLNMSTQFIHPNPSSLQHIDMARSTMVLQTWPANTYWGRASRKDINKSNKRVFACIDAQGAEFVPAI